MPRRIPPSEKRIFACKDDLGVCNPGGREGWESSWGHGKTQRGSQAGHPRPRHACGGPAAGTSLRRGSQGGNQAGAGGNRPALLAGDGMQAVRGLGSPPSPLRIPLSPPLCKRVCL